MGSTEQKEVVGFHFQEIPLDEAVSAVAAGDGAYSEIKAKLLETLPNLADGKAFAFGLPNGKEIPERHRRGLCIAVNSALKRANLPWRVTYSGMKKLFVCVPKRREVVRVSGVRGPSQARPEAKKITNAKALLVLAQRTLGLYETKDKLLRKAVSVIGMNDLKLRPDDIAPLIGLSESGVRFNAASPIRPSHAPGIANVKAAVNGTL